jgi:hypothetical protein
MLATQAASEKDHQHMMDQLGIKELRRGVDNDTKSPHAANYDESKANPYPNLPDPLLLKDGKRVTTAEGMVDQAPPRNRRGLRPRDTGPRSGQSAQSDLGSRQHQTGEEWRRTDRDQRAERPRR